jgi:hypothetical protein
LYVSETLAEMRDKEMILVDESNKSQKVQTLKEILIKMGILRFFFASVTYHMYPSLEYLAMYYTLYILAK